MVMEYFQIMMWNKGYQSHDLQNNYGIEKYKDGSEYRGQYYCGKKNGLDTYKWATGHKYEGEFMNNTFHGYGFILSTINIIPVKGLIMKNVDMENLFQKSIFLLVFIRRIKEMDQAFQF